MKTFFHSGKLGDCIFSLPTIKALGGGVIYLPEKGPEVNNLYSQLKDLLISQTYITDVIQCDDCKSYGDLPIKVDVNLNRHREHIAKGAVNMVKRYFDIFDIKADWNKPWLKGLTPYNEKPYTLFNYTGRFIQNEQTGQKSKVDWRHVYMSVKGDKYFVGTDHEFSMFYSVTGCEVTRMITPNVKELAIAIAGAEAVYCNQSLCLALASGLDIKRYVDFKPGKTNCLFTSVNQIEL